MSVQITRLDNGINVITHDLPHLETVSLGIWVRAGARDEAEAQNGIAHFLEHMAFKGTNKRSAMQIAQDIENVGGDINASTSMETTGYYARVLKEDWRLGLDILSDILTDPVFDREEVERERDVILQEIAAANDTPDDLVFDLAQAAAYPGHALGRPILGPSGQVAGYDADAMMTYRLANYAGERIVVAAAGRIEHEALVQEASRLLGSIPLAAAPARTAPAFGGGASLAERPLDQAHIVLTFPGVGYHDDDVYVMQVLSVLLGGGMSSRLFQEVREKRGLCYSVFSCTSAYEDSGLFSVYAATAPGKADELTRVTSDTMMSVLGSVDEAEVARAKAQLKAGLVMSLESASARADQMARQFLAFGEVPEMATIIEKVERVTPADVSRLAGRILRSGKPALAAVGALGNLAPYEKIAARFA
ncbi:MAG TPA: pitrilysin family protein [Aestuariivirgaceae bacterium]|nr:pitrilysin family protein [Aestuariivirgaceae bacterium]